MHGGDDGRVGAEDSDGGGVQILGGVGPSGRREVGAGAEVSALGAQDGGATAIVVIECGECVGDTADLVEREEVVRWCAQLDGRDEIVADGRDDGVVPEDGRPAIVGAGVVAHRMVLTACRRR